MSNYVFNHEILEKRLKYLQSLSKEELTKISMAGKDGYKFIKGEKVCLNPDTGGSNKLEWTWGWITDISGEGAQEEARIYTDVKKEISEYTFNLISLGYFAAADPIK